MSVEPVRKRRLPVSLTVVTPIVLVVVYVLGVGPTSWLAANGHFSGQTLELLETLYAPLFWSYDNVPGVKYFHDWYVELWRS